MDRIVQIYHLLPVGIVKRNFCCMFLNVVQLEKQNSLCYKENM